LWLQPVIVAKHLPRLANETLGVDASLWQGP